MSEGAYAPDKALWWGDRLDRLRRGDHPAPVHVQLILSDLCNQDCGFCAYRMSGYTSNEMFSGPNGERNPNRMMPYEKAIEVIDDCAEMGVKAIQVTGGGESTIHPQFKEIYVHAQLKGLLTALVTNGVVLKSKDLIAPLMHSSWVRVSLDAADRKTYAHIRHVKEHHYDLAMDSVEALVAEKQKKLSSVVIGLGFVVTKENWGSILRFANLAKSMGVDNIRISGVFQNDGASYFHGFFKEAALLAKEAEGLSDKRFTVYNRFTEKVKDLEDGPPDYENCGYQRFTTYLGADQNLYRCCVMSYSQRGLLGSFKDQRFKDLWFGEAREKLATFDARGCVRCQFNSINKMINKQLEKPIHAEFV